MPVDMDVALVPEILGVFSRWWTSSVLDLEARE